MIVLLIRGNILGLIMFVAVSPIALIGSFLLKLADPITMSCVGVALVAIDLLVRLRSRPSNGWLTQREFGGTLFFLPVWAFGIVVVVINVANALLK
ncbi:hypothetical protein [Pseudanabaena sp. lw0831]|uniref:hypothetical protein n=1 Tax=Pseudanabaena sp. lw0831 TaxID=1357935 RepID=UPI0019160608|nr:hypothetical protein [Pseudanabaena sp. lw0831]